MEASFTNFKTKAYVAAKIRNARAMGFKILPGGVTNTKTWFTDSNQFIFIFTTMKRTKQEYFNSPMDNRRLLFWEFHLTLINQLSQMKCKVLFFAFLMISTGYCAQNLVPNPSFEEYVDCPWSCCSLDLDCVNWYSFSETPDYFNACSEYTAGVPSNPWGHQYAITGSAYAALVTYASTSVDIREYIATPLSSTIAAGESYYVMFYISQSDGGDLDNWRCATDRIGAKFFNDPAYTPDNPYSPDNDSDVQQNGLLADTTNWELVDGWFEADQDYNWVAIGNYYDDEQTDTVQFGEPGKCFGIYYIENVCIAPNPADCDYLKQDSDISSVDNSDQQETSILVFPNPSQGWFQIKASVAITEFKVFNTIGQLIRERKVGQQDLNIDGTNWSKGLYILEVKDENNHQHTFKITKQ